MSSFVTKLSEVKRDLEDNVEVLEPDPPNVDDLRNALVAFGINTSLASYNSEYKTVAQEFLDSGLSNVCHVWNHLDDPAKIRVLDKFSNEFSEWVLSHAK